MRRSFALLSLVSLASAVLPGQEDLDLRQRDPDEAAFRPAMRQDASSSSSSSSSPSAGGAALSSYSNNWAGVVQTGTAFSLVSGTIIVPDVSGGADAAAAAWVGIDGDSCQASLLQTGLAFYGDGSYTAWFEWIPGRSQRFPGFPVRVGDRIKMSVGASGPRYGVASLQNLRTGKTVSHRFAGGAGAPSSLCRTDAEWVVEAFSQGGKRVPLANFGEIRFTDAAAQGAGGRVTPRGGKVVNMRDDEKQQVLTSCGVDGDTATCKYVGNSSG